MTAEEERATTNLFILGEVVTAVAFLLVTYIIWVVFPSDIPYTAYWSGAIALLIIIEILEAYRYIRKKQTKPKPIPSSIKT